MSFVKNADLKVCSFAHRKFFDFSVCGTGTGLELNYESPADRLLIRSELIMAACAKNTARKFFKNFSPNRLKNRNTEYNMNRLLTKGV